VVTGVVVLHRAGRAAKVDTLCLSLAAQGSYTAPPKTFTSPRIDAVRPRLDVGQVAGEAPTGINP